MTKQEVIRRAANIYRANLWQDVEAINYLTSERGLTESTIFKYQIGFACGNLVTNAARAEGWLKEAIEHGVVWDRTMSDFFEGYITFPVFQGPNYFNINGRRLFAGEIPHKTLPNLPKDIVYNLQALNADSVIIAESAIDALTFNQNGFVACAVLGNKLSREMVQRFKGKSCYIFFDRDDGGRIGSRKLAKLLDGTAATLYILEFPGKAGEKVDANSYFRTNPYARSRVEFLVRNSLPLKSGVFGSQEKEKNKKNRNWPEDQVPIHEVGRLLFDTSRITEKSNGELWVRCPHHKDGEETKPSLWIGGKRNIFQCFGCNVGGGPVRLVAWHLEISFDKASRWIQENVECSQFL